ncbi:MAG: hypothetical protein CR993_03330 [Rhodobacterales bacterium]|nr:MAG: hypothetical protein CR993_03330 [Rhodobacterales bacterium]
MLNILPSLLLLLLFLVLIFWLYILLPAGMAKRRGRSAVIWVLICLVSSPLLGCLLLLALGDAPPQTTRIQR